MSLHGREQEDTARRRPSVGGLLRTLFARIPWNESQTAEEISTVPAPPNETLTVRNTNGRTRVLGEDRPDIQIRVTKTVRADCEDVAARLMDSIKLHKTDSGDGLEVEVQLSRKSARHGLAHLELRVPRSTRVSVSSTNGKIHLEGLDRRIRARTSNGSVSIAHITGDIDVTTANAKVDCRLTEGHLRAQSSNGRIELNQHRGSVEAATSNGVIRASIETLAPKGLSLKTSNGRIALELPGRLDVDIDIQVENGHVRNDLELIEASCDEEGRMRGRIGQGGTPIRLRTSNGTVSLRQTHRAQR
jgi:hypothetical protein